MLAKKEQKIIEKLGEEYKAKRIWLFGSNLDAGAEPADIDLAVEGVPPAKFFEFYGKLTWELDRPVDLVVLDNKLPLRHIIRDTGKIVYGQNKAVRRGAKTAHR